MPPKKISLKKTESRKSLSKEPKSKEPKPIGEVTHYFPKIKVAIVKFSKPVKTGMRIHFLGATTNFEQKIESMQFDHKPIDKAKKGQEVGIKVKEKAREKDKVFEVEE